MRVIQLLNWNVEDIEKELEKIKEQGFDTIQINPMQPLKKDETFHWWLSYQPLDFKIGNEFGNKESLKSLCEKANKYGINIIVDVVCNHLANNGENEQLVPNKDINPEILNNGLYWKKQTKINCFDTWNDIVSESIGLPGLNLSNDILQEIIFNYLDDLKECGVKGFRIDAAKHIGLPSDGVSFFKNLQKYLKENNLFGYGEFLEGPTDKIKELSNYITVLTDRKDIKDCDNIITFVESHDTFLNEFGNTKDINYDNIIHDYIDLTKKFKNTLFYVRDSYKPYNPNGKESNNNLKRRKDYSDLRALDSKEIKNAHINKYEKTDYNKLYDTLCEQLFESINNEYTLDDINNIIIKTYNILLKLNEEFGLNSDIEYNTELMKYVITNIYKYSNSILIKNINFSNLYYLVTNDYNKYINKNFTYKNIDTHNKFTEILHDILLSSEKNKTIDDYINSVLKNYKIENYINKELNIFNKDAFDIELLDIIMNELFKENWNKYPLITTNYKDFYIKVLEKLKNNIYPNYKNTLEEKEKLVLKRGY